MFEGSLGDTDAVRRVVQYSQCDVRRAGSLVAKAPRRAQREDRECGPSRARVHGEQQEQWAEVSNQRTRERATPRQHGASHDLVGDRVGLVALGHA